VIALRIWRQEDIPALVTACQDLEILRWTQVPDGYTVEHARSWLGRHTGQMESGQGIQLAVVTPGDDRLLGSIELRVVREKVGEVGYWVAAAARRQGVATRSVKLLTRWAVDSLGLERLQLVVHPGNLASQKVATRAGYGREGLLRSYVEIKGRRLDAVMFSLLPKDLADVDGAAPTVVTASLSRRPGPRP
jgi:RimJ/RimL family protein N-acetyltransferase